MKTVWAPSPRAPLVTVNGIVFGCSTAPKGPLYAFDGATGAKLWEYDAGVSCDTRATVVGDRVYWVVGPKLYAFSTDAPKPSATDAVVAGHNLRDGIYTVEQAERGKALYAQTCATGCHQENLSRRRPRAFARRRGLSRPMGRNRSRRAVSSASAQRCRRPNPGSLTDDYTAAVVAYLLSANGYPAGKDALNPGRALAGVAISK